MLKANEMKKHFMEIFMETDHIELAREEQIHGNAKWVRR